MIRFVFNDFFRCSRATDVTAFCAAFRTYVNNMIHLLDYIHVVFDDNHGVPFVDQSVEYVHQYPNVFKVQPRGGLIQNI